MRVWRKHQVKSRKLVELIVELIFNSHFLPTYIIYKLNVFVHGENANSYSFLPLCSLLKATFATVVKYFRKLEEILSVYPFQQLSTFRCGLKYNISSSFIYITRYTGRIGRPTDTISGESFLGRTDTILYHTGT